MVSYIHCVPTRFKGPPVINCESRGPLCGAEMRPTDLIDACSELANDALGVLAAAGGFRTTD